MSGPLRPTRLFKTPLVSALTRILAHPSVTCFMVTHYQASVGPLHFTIISSFIYFYHMVPVEFRTLDPVVGMVTSARFGHLIARSLFTLLVADPPISLMTLIVLSFWFINLR
jgi:hypothetical protein